MLGIVERARRILSEPVMAESSGLSKVRTPLLVAMRRAVQVGGVTSLMLVAACSSPAPYGASYSEGPTTGNVLGTLGGAAAGAYIGNQFGHRGGKTATTVVGGLLGALVGNALTRPTYSGEMPYQRGYGESGASGRLTGVPVDPRVLGQGYQAPGYTQGNPDVYASSGLQANAAFIDAAEQAAYRSPLGVTKTWRNPATGDSGNFTGVREAFDQNGNLCREFGVAVALRGQMHSGHVVACRDHSGQWHMLQSGPSAHDDFFAELQAEPVSGRRLG